MKTLIETVKLLIFLMIVSGTMLFGYYFGLQAKRFTKPQSPAESQTILKQLGYYEGKIDSDWGDLSETAYCNFMYDYINDERIRKE